MKTANDANLVIVAWTYNTKTYLHIFDVTEDAAFTRQGSNPYKKRYNDEHGISVSHFMNCPKIIND
jgi:hypothetical protein